LLLAALVQACGTSTLAEAAASGDGARLGREISLAQASGELDVAVTREIAAAVLTRDLRTTQGTQAVQLVQTVSRCAPQVDSALRERAARDDDAAVEATLTLLETGRVRADEVLGRPGIRRGRWRIALARALLRPGTHDFRRRLMTDPDERVRRAALRAAKVVPDADDLEVLLEAVRLDPDADSRRRAALAVGAVGGSRAVLGLRDRWAFSDADTRLAIVKAWTLPRATASGGLRELEWAAEQQPSRAAVAASGALAVADPPGARQLGRALVARYIVEGTSAERRLAITHADPSDELARKALEEAAADTSSGVQIAALARLAAHSASRASALRQLTQITKERGPGANAARLALVRLGDASVVPMLQRGLQHKTPARRREAAAALVETGRVSEAAPALADRDLMVRADTACAILLATP
jgi:hypothetical protein